MSEPAAPKSRRPVSTPAWVGATRSRVVLPGGFSAFKCNYEDACRLAQEYGGHVERSTVAAYVDGSELLGPWTLVMDWNAL